MIRVYCWDGLNFSIDNIRNFWGFAKFCHNIGDDLQRFFFKERNWCNVIIMYEISSYNSWHFFKDLCSCISFSSYCSEQTQIIYGNVYWFDEKRFKNRYMILVGCSFLPGFCDFSDHLPTFTLVAMVWFLKIDHSCWKHVVAFFFIGWCIQYHNACDLDAIHVVGLAIEMSM